MVDIDVGRNYKAEADAQKAFHELQSEIFRTFGQRTPSAPVLKCRNATQTSVVLEWDPIDIATAELRSLTLYRNGNKAGTIPKPSDVHSTKLSGLAVDTEYQFHLVLKTSAGTFSSEKLLVQTHKMTDLSGITITPGHMPAAEDVRLAALFEFFYEIARIRCADIFQFNDGIAAAAHGKRAFTALFFVQNEFTGSVLFLRLEHLPAELLRLRLQQAASNGTHRMTAAAHQHHRAAVAGRGSFGFDHFRDDEIITFFNVLARNV